MIRCNEIDGAVCQSFYDGEAVLLFAQRRIHLCKGAVSEHRLIGQCEMMGRSLGVEIGAHCLEHADPFNRATGADVLDHRVGAGAQGQAGSPGLQEIPPQWMENHRYRAVRTQFRD